MLSAVIAAIIGLLVVIGLHELGHALMARMFNVPIKRVSIGFGRPLLKWKSKKGFEWVWALWPVGGYVQLLNTRIEPVNPGQELYAFDKNPIWKRILILLAGILINLLLAWVAFSIIFFHGYETTPPIIAEVIPHSLAAEAGFERGDQFLQVNTTPTTSWGKVGSELLLSLGKKVPVVILKQNGTHQNSVLQLQKWVYKAKTPLFTGLGFLPNLQEQPRIIPGVTLGSAIKEALMQIHYQVIFLLLMLKLLITGVLPFSLLLGPLGIFGELSHSFDQGVIAFLSLLANLNIAVAVINILPIPGLDGGGILYCILEKIRGKPLSIGMEILIYQLLKIFFILFMFQLLLNDLKRYFVTLS